MFPFKKNCWLAISFSRCSHLSYKYRRFAIFLVCAWFLLLWYEKNIKASNAMFFTNQKCFKKYFKMRDNMICPALNENEWKIYRELTTPNVFVFPEERLYLSWKDIGLVTFVSKTHLTEAFANCQSIQEHFQLKTLPMTVFFSYDFNETLILQYKNACPQAKVSRFSFERFPDSVKKMEHYRFKALHEAMALKNHKVVLSFDTSISFNKNANLTEILNSNIKNNPTDVTLLTAANHTMFSTVHPKMYKCFPNINPESMKNVRQFQSGLILWIGSEMGWKAMKRFVECSLQSECIAPVGATKMCDIKGIFNNPQQFSGCHRFDQAAINLILYENSNQKPEVYGKQLGVFQVKRKP